LKVHKVRAKILFLINIERENLNSFGAIDYGNTSEKENKSMNTAKIQNSPLHVISPNLIEAHSTCFSLVKTGY